MNAISLNTNQQTHTHTHKQTWKDYAHLPELRQKSAYSYETCSILCPHERRFLHANRGKVIEDVDGDRAKKKRKFLFNERSIQRYTTSNCFPVCELNCTHLNIAKYRKERVEKILVCIFANLKATIKKNTTKQTQVAQALPNFDLSLIFFLYSSNTYSLLLFFWCCSCF